MLKRDNPSFKRVSAMMEKNIMAEDNYGHLSAEFEKQTVSEIEQHVFMDHDISVEKHKGDYSVGFNIEYKCHVTKPNEYVYMFLNKDDVIALAKHLKINSDDLSR